MSAGDAISAAISLGLLLAAVWLAAETMFLRRATASQVRILQVQDERRVAPYLYTDLRMPAEREAVTTRFYMDVQNLTDNLAFRIDVWMYDPEHKNYRTEDGLQPYLEGKGKQSLSIGQAPSSRQQMLDAVKRDHPTVDPEAVAHAVDAGGGSYAVLFYDVNGVPYLASRVVGIGADGGMTRGNRQNVTRLALHEAAGGTTRVGT
jgi:hypothetical protein